MTVRIPRRSQSRCIAVAVNSPESKTGGFSFLEATYASFVLGNFPNVNDHPEVWGLHRSSHCCCIGCNRSPQVR